MMAEAFWRRLAGCRHLFDACDFLGADKTLQNEPKVTGEHSKHATSFMHRKSHSAKGKPDVVRGASQHVNPKATGLFENVQPCAKVLVLVLSAGPSMGSTQTDSD